MPKVPLNELVPGMRLSRPVTSDSGMVLIGEGTELTESLISRLEGMHVASVSVNLEAREQRSREELLAELDMRFSKTIDKPYMRTLKRICAERIEELLAGDGRTEA